MARSSISLKLTTTEHVLLGMLARYGERSGYELLKLAEGGIAFFWSPAKSHVYDVLPRLERSGHARGRRVSQTGRPDKQLWRITPRGRTALRAWVDTIDPDPFDVRGVFLLKLFFGDHGDPGRLVEHAERFRDQARAMFTTLKTIEERESRGPGDELPWMTLRQGLASAEAHRRWAEEILPELRERAKTRHRQHIEVNGQSVRIQ